MVIPIQDDVDLWPACSSSTACQAMSRRQKPSGHLMRSTACIGTLLRLAHRLPHRANVQHAAAIGEDDAILRHRAGMEDLDALDLGGVIETLDARAFLVVAGITLRRHHHGQRRLGKPAQIEMLQFAVAAASNAGTMSDIIRSISTWHSGSPKRTLYSNSFGPCSVNITPA